MMQEERQCEGCGAVVPGSQAYTCRLCGLVLCPQCHVPGKCVGCQ